MSKSEALLGHTLDKYQLVSLIGEGGMGAVYLGEHSTIKKKVAVKVLHPHLADAYPTIAKRMLKEAQAAAMIGHPDIADVLDYGETQDGTHYLVMELLNGKEMSDLLEERGTLGTHLTLAIADHLLSALEAAHSKGIVHRDLKPENIFLHVDRTGIYQIKLLDFGISKFTADGDMRMTATGAVMGTPYYMSLEQAEGATDVDHRTDIYSTGVILYQALSGALPFTGVNPNQVIVGILKGDFTPLDELCPSLDKGLVSVIKKAMCLNREGRYPNATSLRAALKPFWDPRHPSIQDAFESLGVQSTATSGGILGSGGFSPAPSLPPGGDGQTGPRGPTPPPPIETKEKTQARPGGAGGAKAATAATMAAPAQRLKKTQTAKRFPSIDTNSEAPGTAARLPPGEPTPPPPPDGNASLPPPPPHGPRVQSGEALPASEPPPPNAGPQRAARRGSASPKKRKRVIMILAGLGVLIFLVTLLATEGFGAWDDEEEKKAAAVKKAAEEKKKKRRRRRRSPRFIRDIRRLF